MPVLKAGYTVNLVRGNARKEDLYEQNWIMGIDCEHFNGACSMWSR